MPPSWTEPDFADLVRRADHRRGTRRRYATVGALPVAVMACVLIFTTGGGAPQAITTAGLDDSPSPGLPLPSILPTLPPIGPESPKPSPKPSPSESVDPSQHPSRHPSKDPHPSHGKPPPEPVPDHPAAYAYLKDAAPADCERGTNDRPVTNDPDDRFWCWRYVGPTELANGTETALPFQVCRADTLIPGDGTLHAQGSSYTWMKAVLHNKGEDSWGWYAKSEPYTSSITVAAGDCVQWSIPWPGTDEYGDQLTPGDYVLVGAFIVQETFQDHQGDYGIKVRVTG